MLLWGLISIFGLIIGHRSVNLAFQFQLFEKRKQDLIRLLVAFFILCINLSLRHHLQVLIISMFAVVMMPWLILLLLLNHRQGLFRPMSIEILDSVIVRMRSGYALKESFLWAVSFKPHWIQKIYMEYLQASQFKTNITADKQVRWILDEIEKIQISKHKQIDRLKNLRRKLKTEENFRQKSRKALVQVKAQAIVLTVMYFLLLIITIKFNSWKNLVAPISISSALFVAGSIILLNIGKNYKWKL